MNTPLLSIIIPVYNAASSITVIVSAILAESFRDFELLLVDDGSTDETLETIEQLRQKDARIVVIQKENGGPSSARNAGLEKTRGCYVIFFDADDLIVPGALQTVVNAIEENGSDVVVSGWQIDLPNVTGYKRISPPPTTVRNRAALRTFVLRSIGTDGTLYNLWNKLFRADIIAKNKLRFRDDVRFGEDLIFALHYFTCCESMTIIPDITYRYRVESENSVFGSSSLSTEYRQVNNDELWRFAGEDRNEELNDLTGWVAWRWLLSYYLLVSTSRLPWGEKVRRVRVVSTERLRIASTPKHIGIKKVALECVAAGLRHSPVTALIAGRCGQALKTSLRTIKTFWKKR